MIAIIDYGVGNIRSVMCALRRLDVQAQLVSDYGGLEAAEGLILPGVGAFSRAIGDLKVKELPGAIKDFAGCGKPLLGICVGHQLLFSKSYEHGIHGGLDLVPGCVRRFRQGTKIPHMGWNRVDYRKESVLFDGVADGSFFYFAHSFHAAPEDENAVLTTTEYGIKFTSSVQAGNIFGVQFHPEKSGEQGLKVLANFCRFCCSGTG